VAPPPPGDGAVKRALRLAQPDAAQSELPGAVRSAPLVLQEQRLQPAWPWEASAAWEQEAWRQLELAAEGPALGPAAGAGKPADA
jgi:hypothetical protein